MQVENLLVLCKTLMQIIDQDPYNGLRMTKQRKVVYDVLLEQRDHPTAQVIYERAQEKLSSVSLATIYNCLEALVTHEVVKQVNIDREPSRYCPNLAEHGHFHDKQSGDVIDIQFKPNIKLTEFLDLPEGAVIEDLELNIKGFLKTQTTL